MREIKINCYQCNNSFLKNKSEYNRQIKNNNFKFFCSKECFKKSKIISEMIVKNCLYCNNKFSVINKKNQKTCCSKTCSSKYSAKFNIITNEFREKMRIKTKISSSKRKNLNIDRISHKKYRRICVVCNNNFIGNSYNVKTCNKVCRINLMSKLAKNNPNCGGQTNYKKYTYNGISMDSSWEVELAKWLDDNKICWERSRKLMFYWIDENGSKRRYYPDFYLKDLNIYCDPKNKYLEKIDKFKLESVMKENNVEISYGKLDSIKNRILELIK